MAFLAGALIVVSLLAWAAIQKTATNVPPNHAAIFAALVTIAMAFATTADAEDPKKPQKTKIAVMPVALASGNP